MSGPKFTRRQTIAMGSAAVAASLVPGAFSALAQDPGPTSPPEQPLYDPVTGLPGEQLFLDRIRELEAMKADTFLGISVAVIDIQDFGRFRTRHNDVTANSVALISSRRLRRHLWNHQAIPQIISERLQRHLWQHHDVLARLRDDQFGLLFTTTNHSLIAGDLISMQQTLGYPFHIQKRENVLTTHIGVMRKQAHVHLGPDLIAIARQAAVNARRTGRGGPHFYDAGIVGLHDGFTSNV